jgi:NAD(P)H-hydrate epimerase
MDAPFWLSRAEVRELDRRAIDEFGVPSIVLMENAGRSTAELLMRLNPERQPVTILCGPGNNGGDGFVMARHLDNHGWPIRAWLIAPARNSSAGTADIRPRLSADCDGNFGIIRRSGITVSYVDSSIGSELSNVRDRQLRCLMQETLETEGWIVDALLGTGLARGLEFPFSEIAEVINYSGKPVLAVDIPSGIDCDTGQPLGPTVKTTHTATFVAWKKGFLEPEAKKWTGEIHVIDIGAPMKLVDQFRALRG